jgi:biotin carboxyl carrier protein
MSSSKTYIVSPGENATTHTAVLNGTSSTVDGTTVTLIPTDRHGVYVVMGQDQETPVYVEADGIDHVTIHLRGYAYRARILRDEHHELMAVLESSPAMQTRVVKVTSPMPGLLKSIFISEGESVGKGQALFTLEAMKMENAISASHAGTIRNLTAKEGMAVEKGAPLCIIEPA